MDEFAESVDAAMVAESFIGAVKPWAVLNKGGYGKPTSHFDSRTPPGRRETVVGSTTALDSRRSAPPESRMLPANSFSLDFVASKLDTSLTARPLGLETAS